MDLARSVQVVTEEIMLRMTRTLFKETQLPNLCLAGGVALNCVGNGRILREGPFEDLWIQPAAGDAGGALGAAMIAWHHYLDKPRALDGHKDLQKASRLGPEFTDEQIAAFISEHNLPAKKLPREKIPSEIAALIEAGKVIGWFQGRPSSAGLAFHHRRSPQSGNAVGHELEDQVSRILSPLCSHRYRGTCLRGLRY